MEIRANIITRFATALVLLTAAMSTMTSCRKTVKPTAIQIEDSIRHYPATILGDELVMEYTVRNIGNDMLVITEIQPAVPTIEVDEKNVNMIPPGKEAKLKFTFHSDKNIGLARHIIRIFGNIVPNGEAQIIFDTHVVRPSTNLSDYEEYYQDHLDQETDKKEPGERNLEYEYTTEPKTDGRDKENDQADFDDANY